MYSETGFKAQARTRLHGPVWPSQRRPDSTALVWFKDTSKLKTMGIDFAQGYLLHLPEPIDALMELQTVDV